MREGEKDAHEKWFLITKCNEEECGGRIRRRGENLPRAPPPYPRIHPNAHTQNTMCITHMWMYIFS